MDKGIIEFVYDDKKNKIYPEFNYVIKTLFQASLHEKPDSPNIIAVMVDKGVDVYNHKFTLAPFVYFSYLDYLEVVEARKAASSARLYSIIGIFIAVISLLFQVFKD